MVKSYTLKIKGALEIAHRLPDYEGACSHLHGHCMHYILNFKGKLQDNGMVEDFKFLKEVQGHSPMEVFIGCLLGFFIGLAFSML